MDSNKIDNRTKGARTIQWKLFGSCFVLFTILRRDWNHRPTRKRITNQKLKEFPFNYVMNEIHVNISFWYHYYSYLWPSICTIQSPLIHITTTNESRWERVKPIFTKITNWLVASFQTFLCSPTSIIIIIITLKCFKSILIKTGSFSIWKCLNKECFVFRAMYGIYIESSIWMQSLS